MAPLLAGCHTTPAIVCPDFRNGYVFPDCADGQSIVALGDGTFGCVQVLYGPWSPPVCLPGREVLTSEVDPMTFRNEFKCVPLGTGANDATTMNRIAKAQMDVNSLQVMVDTIIQSSPSIRSKYVGVSATKVSGGITSGGSRGLSAAKLVCEGQYGAGAHMCTPFEIYETIISATSGALLDGSADAGPGLVYMQAWSNGYNGIFGPPAAAADASAGQDDNCGGYTVNTAGGGGLNQWTGTTFKWVASAVDSTQLVTKFYADTSCATQQPVACCK